MTLNLYNTYVQTHTHTYIDIYNFFKRIQIYLFFEREKCKAVNFLISLI